MKQSEAVADHIRSDVRSLRTAHTTQVVLVAGARAHPFIRISQLVVVWVRYTVCVLCYDTINYSNGGERKYHHAYTLSRYIFVTPESGSKQNHKKDKNQKNIYSIICVLLALPLSPSAELRCKR